MMRLLALVPGGIGDQVLFFPTLQSLKLAYPQAQIDLVTEPRAAGAYRVCQNVTKVWQFDFKANNSAADWANLIGNIREQEYDLVLSLGKSWAVGFLLWLTGIPQRVGFDGKGRMFLTNPVMLQPEQYAAVMYHDLLRGLDIALPCPPIKLNLPKADLEWSLQEQQNLGIKDSGYILIHGGSSQLAKLKGIDKIYPPSSWVQVIQELQAKLPNLPVVLINGPEDQALVAEITQAVPQVLTTAPGDIGKLAAMIGAANLLLCTDSAPMHLGVAVGTSLVALFGPTDPARLLPSDRSQIKFVRSRPGEPIRTISPTQILQTLGLG
ncbi:MAG: glycosyltransferase family 9 protein [Pseudanabaenaceae cyanobacterium bins.68]|nr:glycosyltransferase family 9 protein [Pseudanabaenaceae cyanobacterium bins.68]